MLMYLIYYTSDVLFFNFSVQDILISMINTVDLHAVALQVLDAQLQGDPGPHQEVIIPRRIDRDGPPLGVHLGAQVINSRIPNMQQTLLPQSFQNINVQGRQRKLPCLLLKAGTRKILGLAIKIIPLTKTNQTETHP